MANKVDFFHARLEWVEGESGNTLDYGSYSRTHTVHCPEKPSLKLSAAPQYNGNPEQFNPEELFTASISSCQMLTYLALAAFAKIRVLAYTDDAEGMLDLKGKKRCVTRILLRPKILISKEEDKEKALSLVEKAHQQCFIASSVNTEIVNQAEVIVA